MLSRDQVVALYPRADDADIDAFVAQAPDLFRQSGIAATPNRLSYFLAQIGEESGGLSIREENLNYSAARLMVVWPSRFPTLASTQGLAGNPKALADRVYAGRMGNGPEASGDGYAFRGRGYMQLTGRANYAKIGALAGIDLLADPDRAAAPEDALRVACAFWTSRDCNVPCDAGDFLALTRLINGGTEGMDARRAWLEKVRRVLADPSGPQPSAAIVRAVQLALRARGFTQVGAADGIVGAHTAAAIRLFRHRNGLPDGLIDEALLDAFGIAH